MDPIALTRALVGKLNPQPTFPVLVEGETLHFPIHHRHAPIGTVHRWSDGKSYRKTVDGWKELTEPAAPAAAAPAPVAAATPATMVNSRGRTVLAKNGFPVQYANNTQALKKIAELGDDWEILQPSMFGRGLQIAQKAKPVQAPAMPTVHATPGTRAAATHAVLDTETGISNSHHDSAGEAQTVADQLASYHKRAYHVAALDHSPAHEPKMKPEHVALGGTSRKEVRHYNTQRDRPEGTPLYHNHAVVDSDTGKIISTHATRETANGGAIGRMHNMTGAGEATGVRAHVEVLKVASQEDQDAEEARIKAKREQDDAASAAYHASPEGNWIKGPEQLAPQIEEKPKAVPQEMHDAIVKFAHQVSAEKAAEAIQNGYVGKIHVDNFTPRVHYKLGWAYVDMGGSGRYMIALKKPASKYMQFVEPGDVVGIKAYGVPHPGMRRGNVLRGDAKPRRYM